MDKYSRKAIIKETIKFLDERPGISADTKFFSVDARKLMSRSEKYPAFDTKIEVTNEDTLYATSRLQVEAGETYCFLVFGNAFHPGGGYLRGAQAQEESIARRTNIAVAFPDSGLTPPKKALRYPLPEFGGAYIRNVVIFRDSEKDECAFHRQGTVSNAIIGTAYRRPECTYVPRKGVGIKGEADETKADEAEESNNPADYKLTRGKYERTARKIAAILEIALRNNQYNLVLGAIGCGAFYNPPYDIAEIFRDQLNSPAFKNRFKHVVFAVPKSKYLKNHEIFAEVLTPASAPEPTKTASKESTIMVGDVSVPIKGTDIVPPDEAPKPPAKKKRLNKRTTKTKIQSLAGPGYKPKSEDFPPLG